MFFDVNEHYCPLESPTTRHPIPFGGFPADVLHPEQFDVIVPFLRSRPTPCKLSLDSGCVPALIRALDAGVCIGFLKIRGARLREGDLERLLSTANARCLLELELDSADVSPGGCGALAAFLRKDSTTLRRLDFGRSSPLGVGRSQALLRAIPPTSTLRRIELGPLHRSGDVRQAAQTLADLICDRSSFDALCGSNHRLEHVGRDRARAMRCGALREALEINGRRGRSPGQRCRSKLRAFYFRGEFDLRPFVRMDVALMPNVLELVTMSEECIVDKKEGRAERGTYVTARNGQLGGIYRLVRNCHLPELCSFPSQEEQLERLRAKNAALETTIGGLKQNIEWLNEKLLCMCASTDYYEPNKRLKRKAKQ